MHLIPLKEKAMCLTFLASTTLICVHKAFLPSFDKLYANHSNKTLPSFLSVWASILNGTHINKLHTIQFNVPSTITIHCKNLFPHIFPKLLLELISKLLELFSKVVHLLMDYTFSLPLRNQSVLCMVIDNSNCWWTLRVIIIVLPGIFTSEKATVGLAYNSSIKCRKDKISKVGL